MSDETVMDMSLDTQTWLLDNFTCENQILILSPHLMELPIRFLYGNTYVKKLDMSKCTKITKLCNYFCVDNIVEHIIWPPNIETIYDNCLRDNRYLQKLDLSYCKQLSYIGPDFCSNTNVIEIILPVSIQEISFNFCKNNKTLKYLDISHCIHLTEISLYFCANTNIQSIKFPKSLKTISRWICYVSSVYELDFSECKDLKIDISGMCEVKVLKLYSIDNIKTIHTIYCENLYIYNITKTKSLYLSFVKGLKNVHLPEGEYCITDITDSSYKDYSNINLWLGDFIVPTKHFTYKKEHIHSHMPVSTLAVLDTPLETV
jgi:hypothetical protein